MSSCFPSTLISAAGHGNLAAVECHLVAGEDLEAFDGGPLRLAVANGHLTVVDRLLEAGAKVATGAQGHLPWAIRAGHIEIVLRLLQTGLFDLRTENQALLNIACESRDALALSIMLPKVQPPLSEYEIDRLKAAAKEHNNTAAVETLNAYAVGLKLLGDDRLGQSGASQQQDGGGLRL